MENWIIRIIDKGYKLSRDIYIYRRANGGGTEVLNNDGTATTYQDSTTIPDKPFMEMSPEMLQAFSDSLAGIGIKPQKGFVEGKLEATEKHLEDMRTLVFKGQPPIISPR